MFKLSTVTLTSHHFRHIQPLKGKQAHSEWFDVKWFTVEKLTDLNIFTVVVIGTGSRHVCRANVTLYLLSSGF